LFLLKINLMSSLSQLKTENKKLQNKNNNLEKAKKYAWGKYYGEMRDNLISQTNEYKLLEQLNNNIEIPNNIKLEYCEMLNKLKKNIECPICMTVINPQELSITNCGHKYCKECLDKLIDRTNKCAMCRKKLKY